MRLETMGRTRERRTMRMVDKAHSRGVRSGGGGVGGGPVQWIAFWITICSLLGLADANWMYLGLSSVNLPMPEIPAAVSSSSSSPLLAPASSSSDQCPTMPGLLILEQLRVCQENPQAMPCVSLGASLGISECHSQFKSERWNCTLAVDGKSLFGEVLEKGTRESAFIYAITSAGVVHAVTGSCSAGNLTDCSCDNSRSGQATDEGWRWGGCSDNIDYGTWFARTFVDAPERIRHTTTKDLRALMNLHNNRVGRKVLSDEMQTKCRCHGVSGSCSVKTCWRSLPSFGHIGAVIKDKYEKSVGIAARSTKRLRRKEKRYRRQTVNEDMLVYLENSPNYCRRNRKVGVLGTRGRECKREGKGAESCDMLCCGRGYNTQVVRHVERCHCKFIWCCEVRCKTCETLVDVHTCK